MAKRKKEKGRTYTELKNSMGQEQFDKYCKNIATRYAKSEERFSSTYFMAKENIKESCFRLILRDAVVKNLVSDELVDKMEKKSMFNQSRHYQDAGKQSELNYVRLRKKRRANIISTYSNEYIKEIAESFAEYVELTLDNIAEMYDVSQLMLSEILEKAFVENIADDETCKKIAKRSIRYSKDKEKTENIFDFMWKQRKSYKEGSK